MAESKELRKIKKKYGERFMHLCRSLFPTILETEGRLLEILSLYFSDNSKTLYEDILNNNLEEEFKEYIYSKIDVEDSEKKIVGNKTPYEILEEAGYDLVECTTEEEIQSFRKYYAPREELCTFKGRRLNTSFVFFTVRKDVENIKREDFQSPNREDEYSTSVMGIQFNKRGKSTVDIISRYNHTVNNPNATYGNDLDKIAYGLRKSFEELLKERGIELSSDNIESFQIPGYVVANDGKYYKYNMEIDGIYYCPGNIIIERGKVHKIENPEKQILIDYFILDIENKTLKLYDQGLEDGFTEDFQELEKIEITKNRKRGTRTITIKKAYQEAPIIIEIDRDNQIVRYENEELKQVGNYFLGYNKGLIELKSNNLEQAGRGFLCNNDAIPYLELPNLVEVGNYFLLQNNVLTVLKLPSLEKAGYMFLEYNNVLKELYVPKLPQLREQFSSMIAENKKKKEVLDAREIAELDKQLGLTTSEIHQARKIVNKTMKKEYSER